MQFMLKEARFPKYDSFLRILKCYLKFVDVVSCMLQLKFLERVCVHTILNSA